MGVYAHTNLQTPPSLAFASDTSSTLEEELDKLGCHYEEDFSPTW